MNEKYRKYIKNLPFIELFYNFNFVRQENKKFNDSIDIAIKSYSDIEKVKQFQKTKTILNTIMWSVNIIIPLFMFFVGFFGYWILHNTYIYLILLSLPISYYTIAVYQDILKEKTEQFEQLKNSSFKELIIGASATMTIWNYAYLSIGILIAMLI